MVSLVEDDPLRPATLQHRAALIKPEQVGVLAGPNGLELGQVGHHYQSVREQRLELLWDRRQRLL